jgi:hypothetical protein
MLAAAALVGGALVTPAGQHHHHHHDAQAPQAARSTHPVVPAQRAALPTLPPSAATTPPVLKPPHLSSTASKDPIHRTARAADPASVRRGPEVSSGSPAPIVDRETTRPRRPALPPPATSTPGATRCRYPGQTVRRLTMAPCRGPDWWAALEAARESIGKDIGRRRERRAGRRDRRARRLPQFRRWLGQLRRHSRAR